MKSLASTQATKSESQVAFEGRHLVEASPISRLEEEDLPSPIASPSSIRELQRAPKPQWGFASSLAGRRVCKAKPRYRRELLSDVPQPVTTSTRAKQQAQWFEQRDEEEEAHKASTTPVQQQRFQDDEHFLQQEQMLLHLQQQERQIAMVRNWEEQQLVRQQAPEHVSSETQARQAALQKTKKSMIQGSGIGKLLSISDLNQIVRSPHEHPEDPALHVGLTPPGTGNSAGHELREQVEVPQLAEHPMSRLGVAESASTSRQGKYGGSTHKANAWWADQKPNLLGNRGNWRAPRLWAVGK